jgi:hypothetical protein
MLSGALETKKEGVIRRGFFRNAIDLVRCRNFDFLLGRFRQRIFCRATFQLFPLFRRKRSLNGLLRTKLRFLWRRGLSTPIVHRAGGEQKRDGEHGCGVDEQLALERERNRLRPLLFDRKRALPNRIGNRRQLYRDLDGLNLGLRWRGRELLDCGNETVTAPREGFDIAGSVGGVAQGFAELVDGGVQAVAEVDKGIVCPDPFAELLAGDELPRSLQEGRKNLKRLAGELYSRPGFAELAGGEVHFKRTEAETSLDEVGHLRGDSIIWIDGPKGR